MDVRPGGRPSLPPARAAVLAVAAGFTALHVAAGGGASGIALGALAGVVVWALLWPAAETGQGAATGTIGEADAGAARLELPRRLVDGLPDAAVLLDDNGVIVGGNAAAGALAAVPEGAPLARWCRAPELLSAAEAAGSGGQRQHCTFRLLSPVERSLDAVVVPLAGVPGVAGDLRLVVVRDLTEQEQMARMRVDFVANASHELRTPLAALRGFIETLRGPARDDPLARERFLGIMQEQAERMSRLIDDLLSLSRIEMREHVAPTGKVDLAAVARYVGAALRQSAEDAGIAIRMDFGADPAWATGDRDELVQVVQNLVQNGLRYGRRGGSVTVTTQGNERSVLLSVADDGIGIAAEHIPRLTERFYRVSAKESKERGGTGLGLAIVKHIVNRHRGELRIDSELGRGSAFTVVLPVARGES